MTPDNKVNDLLQQMRLAVENARAANAYSPLTTRSTSRAKALISSVSSEETSQPRTLILLTHELMTGIETRFGIKPSSLVQRKLIRILNDMPITAMRDWVESLKNCSPDHSEWQALAENLTVQETYFCRDPELMRMLTEDILPYLIAIRKKQKKLQVWSAASSTGEEVYDLSFCALRALQNA
jgi:chemotaxis protein methyltransferase CheR